MSHNQRRVQVLKLKCDVNVGLSVNRILLPRTTVEERVSILYCALRSDMRHQ